MKYFQMILRNLWINWIVRLKDNAGNFVNLGKFTSEEEANKAKNDFLNSL